MHRSKALNVLLALSFALALTAPGLSWTGGSVEAAPTSVFINEIHYDNASTDSGEAIEIAGPAGTDLTGWSLVRYNGANGQVYTTPAADPAGSDVLSGTIPDLGGGYGVVVVNYLSNGLQNGAPDGVALVDDSNNVVQFLSYEGTFAATNGPANGMTSVDIGVSEDGSGAVGDSLQLTGTGTSYEDFTWTSDSPNTFGAFNTGQTFGSAPPPSPTVFINEIHYDNAGADTGEAIEVAGPAGTDLTGWSVVLYNGNGGAVYDTIDLSGIIPDQENGYGTLSFPRAGIQNGSPDGLALVDDSDALVQFLSYEGTFTGVGGPADGLLSTDIGVSENGSGAVGDSLQLTGAGTAYDDFTWAADAPNTFDAVNTGQCFVSCPVSTDPSGIGNAVPDLVSIGEASLLSVQVTPGTNPPSTGLGVSCDLSAIGGGSSQTFYDDGSNGDVTPDDGTFSFEATPTSATSASHNDFACTLTDSQSRSGSATVSLDVIVPIGTVQGSVGDTADGFNFASPLAGQTATIQGVIYENLLARTSSGGDSHTFFIQNTLSTADGDPNSSDGLYVYIGFFSTLRVKGGGFYAPKVGDEVVLQGPVQEFYGQTELSNPYVIQVVRHDVDLTSELSTFTADPPADLAAAYRYWERREGMRGRVPAGSIVLNGRNVFASTADAEVWVTRPDSVIADRSDPYTRRAFRDAHPLDDNYNPATWDGNGYRILLASLGIKAAAGDNMALISPARTFDTLSGEPVGGVYFDFGKYSIQPDQQISLSDGPDPSLNSPPQAFDRSLGYSIADFNLENLYDYRNNPFSGCDFAGDTGCSHTGTPFIADVSPPYDYVPAGVADYQARLNDIAQQIINDLHSPDILMVQEVENQDVCTVSGSALDCGTTDNADGKPDVLQELALKIAADGGPAYDAAFDRDSSDLRGIAPAFMYRSDRVQLLSPVGDPLLGASPAIPGYTAVPYDADISNPKTLNAVYTGSGACETTWVFPRAPDIGLFRIWRAGVGSSVFTDVYVINNHFKSAPDTCVGHRTAQAGYNAAIVAFLQAANPAARIVVGGDLNVYPRPDDPFAPIGQPGSSDQLGALYDPGLGLKNLWEVLLGQAPGAAYSYVYVGMAQTLDQMFVNQPMLADLKQFRSAHINSDFPADYPGDVARGTSDHDPQVASESIAPTVASLEALLNYFVDQGAITGNNTAKDLLDHLDKAGQFLANGQDAAYRAQLQAFINQVQGKAPKFVTQEAADALSAEAALLLGP